MVSLLAGSGTQAALFCVDTGAELQPALTTAGNNAEAGTIRTDSGVYEVASEAVAFEYIVVQNISFIALRWPCGHQHGRRFLD